MKRINLLTIIFMVILTSCSVKVSTENFFMNEDFILLNKKEERIGDKGVLVRTWLIQRVIQDSDSVQIGEIFDAIDFHDLLSDDKFDAICFLNGYETLPNTDGEHHIMTAILLKKTK